MRHRVQPALRGPGAAAHGRPIVHKADDEHVVFVGPCWIVEAEGRVPIRAPDVSDERRVRDRRVVDHLRLAARVGTGRRRRGARLAGVAVATNTKPLRTGSMRAAIDRIAGGDDRRDVAAIAPIASGAEARPLLTATIGAAIDLRAGTAGGRDVAARSGEAVPTNTDALITGAMHATSDRFTRVPRRRDLASRARKSFRAHTLSGRAGPVHAAGAEAASRARRRGLAARTGEPGSAETTPLRADSVRAAKNIRAGVVLFFTAVARREYDEDEKSEQDGKSGVASPNRVRGVVHGASRSSRPRGGVSGQPRFFFFRFPSSAPPTPSRALSASSSLRRMPGFKTQAGSSVDFRPRRVSVKSSPLSRSYHGR